MGDTGAAEEDYRDYDFAHLSVISDVTQGNDVLLAAYHADVETDTDFLRMAMTGTGGSGLWEREWLDFMNRDGDAGYEARDMQVAMCFAEEVAAPYRSEIVGVQQEFFRHSEASRVQREGFDGNLREALLNAGGNWNEAEAALRGMNELRAETQLDSVTQYVNDHPSAWLARSDAYVATLKGIQELGEHHVLMGLLQDDTDVVIHGRAVMQYAADAAHDMNDYMHNVTYVADALYGALNSHDPAEKAVTYTKVQQCMDELFSMVDRPEPGVSEFVARWALNQEHAARYHDNMSVFFDLDPIKSGGIAGAMRDISDASYRDRSGGPLVDAQEALAARDEGLVADLLDADRRFNEAMHAVAFYNEPRMQEFNTETAAIVGQLESGSAEQAAAELRQMAERVGQVPDGLDHPVSYLETAMRNLAAEHYVRAAEGVG